MIVYFSPQVNDKVIEYKFESETITATIDEITDIFDFSSLNEGDEVARNETTGQLEIETILPILPILEAKRENGVVKVTVLYWIGEDASYEDKFPEPLEVK